MGMYILQVLPQGNIAPQGLVKGSREHAEKFMAKISSYFRMSPSIVKEWQDWLKDVAPQSDDVLKIYHSNVLFIELLCFFCQGA